MFLKNKEKTPVKTQIEFFRRVDFNNVQGYEYPEFKNDKDKDFKEEYSVNDLLKMFSKKEILDEQNSWYCNKCKEHVEAFKKI